MIIRRFAGNIDVELIIASWEYLIQNLGSFENYKGVITDLLNANLVMGVVQLEELLKYLMKNREIFGNIRLAVLVDSKDVIFPMMAGNKIRELQIKPFATEKAAISWINS